MERRKRSLPTNPVIDSRYGVSFSIKQCRSFSIDPHKTLEWLLDEAGFRRFRLMSYWNEVEKTQGSYDFSSLDWQLDRIAEADGTVSLCLGARQPRWPENHWPDWVWQASHKIRTDALLAFITVVVKRYKDHPALESYQLENEALLKSFGTRSEVDRKRLRNEYELVKQLDPRHPVIMTTSTSWGTPLRRPIPDRVGFSYYFTVYNGKRYTSAGHSAMLHRMRARLIRLTHRRDSFIHELQLEPWGPHAIWEMSEAEQDASMDAIHIAHNLFMAQQTGLYPIYLWGCEWWYWRLQVKEDASTWEAVKTALHTPPL